MRVDTVTMPYPDDDHTAYDPNQILVNWSNYKYNEADVVMMEDDGDTNYATLAKALADALPTITDQGTYIPLVDAIPAALPTSWYTNDADYVDSWYALARSSSGRVNGARGNGWGGDPYRYAGRRAPTVVSGSVGRTPRTPARRRGRT